LDMWTPQEMEKVFFSIYSPAHAVMWWLVSPTNWILVFLVMLFVSLQLHGLTISFDMLLKDKQIISSEVLHEYNEKFVSPQLNKPRANASVQTHEAEMITF